MNQPIRRQRRRPASNWPEMDEIGTPAYDEEDSEILGEGFSWEVAPAEEDGRLITTLWLPTPDGTHTPYDVYATAAPEPPARPRFALGFRKGSI